MITIYTDGSCKPTNPGPAGYGVVVVIDNELASTGCEYIGVATNNVAELGAVMYALRILESMDSEWEPSVVISDSQYVIGLLSKNWKPRKNKELVAKIRAKLENFPNLAFKWVKGHSGDKYNEIADQLAKSVIDTTVSGLEKY